MTHLDRKQEAGDVCEPKHVCPRREGKVPQSPCQDDGLQGAGLLGLLGFEAQGAGSGLQAESMLPDTTYNQRMV